MVDSVEKPEIPKYCPKAYKSNAKYNITQTNKTESLTQQENNLSFW